MDDHKYKYDGNTSFGYIQEVSKSHKTVLELKMKNIKPQKF